ncbi:uncharacterized protein LOC127535044 isoform X2 [Acanthochromis polyacanthus]|uniref:uncharacterized protein LOC127535044 isoform X2 n=1 Tax=Acanthochromis polyacanthus TaxID=80966 RepID=UPI0022347E9A|nr:uncharacterized protein LOC127535044 isoform X2 [Acanthochromis polyacanthus]
MTDSDDDVPVQNEESIAGEDGQAPMTDSDDDVPVQNEESIAGEDGQAPMTDSDDDVPVQNEESIAGEDGQAPMTDSDDDVPDSLPEDNHTSSFNSEDESLLDTFSEASVDTDPFRPRIRDQDMDTVISPAGTTKAEALLMVMSHAAKHNITGTQLEDLLTLINTLFGKEILPRSKYLFNKCFKNNSDLVNFHYYCKSCKIYLGMQKDIHGVLLCPNCESPIEISTLNNASFFIDIPIAPQIRTQLESPEIQMNLNYRHERSQEHEVIADIYDGEMYKKMSKPHRILSNPNNFSFNFNSDGSPVFKSSKFSIWPIQLHLNELPPKIRFKNVILAGLWFGAHEPVMPIFLKPFVEQANTLASTGVVWDKNGDRQNSKVIGLCCCVDSKARPAMQNTTQFNGYFGCGFCLHPGTLVEKQVKYTVTAEYPERESKDMLADMEMAVEQHKSVRGVKGPSPLINMPYFDIVWGFIPDYMHAVLLGVVRQLTELFLHSSNQPYYNGSPTTMQVLNKRMSCIKPPHLITRLPRPLSECRHWKASEWRAWLLFYCLPVLNGVLQQRYFRHLSLLVSSVFILLKEQITFDEINKADEMLFEFVARVQLIYGEAQMTSNVHLLTHLCKSVKLWGPLWAHSAFVFENANGCLLKLVHGTKSIAMQVATKFLLFKSIPILTTHFAVSDNVKKFCLVDGRLKGAKSYPDCTVLDNGRVMKTTEEEKTAFSAAQREPPQELDIHKRMVHRGLVFTSANYSRSKRRKDCYVKLTNGTYGEIQSIVSTDVVPEVYVLLKKLDTGAVFSLWQDYGFVSHIRRVHRTDSSLCLVSVKDLVEKCIVLKIGEETYICDFPNAYERD